MSLRQIQVTVPRGQGPDVCDIMRDCKVTNFTLMKAAPGDPTELVIATLPTGAVESLLDKLKRKLDLSSPEHGVISLLEVRATIPPLEPAEVRTQASREELYNSMNNACRLDSNFLLLIIISTGIATLGLLRDNTAYIIGSMIVAPLLGPAVAMCFATVLGDTRLFARTTRTELVGIGVTIACAALIALFFNHDASNIPRAIESRVHPSPLDVGLAVGGGIAAVLTQLTGLSAALVGVMIAIALLPPAAVIGIGIAQFNPPMIAGAFVLLSINLVSINIAGTLTFLLKGVRPSHWYYRRKARQQIKGRLIIWATLLVLIIAAMLLYGALRLRA